MCAAPVSVTVLYADHAAMRKSSSDLLFNVSCLGDTASIKTQFPTYKEAFQIVPIPGMGIEDLCEECFDRGNLDQPLISEAGRCMCVGDVVRIGMTNGVSVYRICASEGWEPFTPQ